ncbi:hypothetical protein GCK72_007835 [Caenorhabditis remanei]|uniref:Domain of unknown function WSN domain-containing protein n=1 Tax=Caenorhabditis remanei TaxID=31234 RepID=A0A6A5HMI0_CAERE|nr:hypothetical protein GCK72_007835 [Caenorhabditis remanei]KAF1767876.1 hypothetical protein GCK72_007835 [Caenorhabditis remanei]
MRTIATTLIICIFFASSVNAGITTRHTNATFESIAPPPTDMDTELEKISKGCITIADYTLLTNKDVTWYIASMIGRELVRESVSTIGLLELRGALHFGPMAPWTKLNYTSLSKDELAPATLEQYYDLKEPKSLARSLHSLMIMEKDIPRGVAFMDERFPGIRKIFAQKFQKMMRKGGKMVMDRKMVDRMIEEYSAMDKKIRDAIEKTSYNNYCWDRSSLF